MLSSSSPPLSALRLVFLEIAEPRRHTPLCRYVAPPVLLSFPALSCPSPLLVPGELSPPPAGSDLTDPFPVPSSLLPQTGPSFHIELNSSFLFVNHSCSPNVAFVLSASSPPSTWRVEAVQDLEPGTTLTFFYPSTEWEMDRGFQCRCGEKVSRELNRAGGEREERDADFGCLCSSRRIASERSKAQSTWSGRC